MDDPHQLEDVAQYNERSLRTLIRAINFSQGRFSLILARCNYEEVYREIRQKLREQFSIEVRELVLDDSTKTLYKAIKEKIEAEQTPEKDLTTTTRLEVENFALMVLGLGSVENIDGLLRAANQVRDEFRKSFQFPLVLWVNDEVLKKLVKLAPDFNNWAGVPIQFSIATNTLINALRQKAEQLFDNVFDAGSGKFLPNCAILGFHYRLEFELALRDLQSRESQLEPLLEAYKQFVLGRDDYTSDRIEVALERYEQSLMYWQEINHSERQGVLLFHIGLCYGRQAELHRLESRSYLEKARDAFQQCLDVFEEAQHQDWVAKFISQLGEVLRRLGTWDELDMLARKSLSLHRTNGNHVQLAQDYGFLAEVALNRNQAKDANLLAYQALQTLEEAPEPHPQHQGLYLLLLAQSQQSLGLQPAALRNLERARKEGNHQYDPQLYIQILETLRSLYFEQGQYRAAFEIKQEQRSIEQQYGFRAFIGAGRLQPQRQTINPAFLQTEQQVTVAQEIAAFGRQQDVSRLIERITRNDCKFTVIYGPSGVGKSSLITAGLLPALKQKLIQARDALPIVVQGYSDWIGELGRHLATALEETRGLTLTTTLDSAASLVEQLKKHEDFHLLTILIFDQFEEFFNEDYIPRTKRRVFYEFLKVCFNLPFVKIFILIREDYFHYFLKCKNSISIDSLHSNILGENILYYLGNFSLKDAKIVIHSLTESSQFKLDSALVDEILQDLACEAGEILPIELQLVGSLLQAERIETLEEYHQLGLKNKLVGRFLEAVVRDCGPENERAARLVLYLLTDKNNTRPLKTPTELTAGLVAEDLKLESENLEFILKILVDSGLLLRWSFPTACYQLIHDYLVPFIQQEKGAEFDAKLKKANAERQRIEEQLSRVRKWRQRAVVLAGSTTILAILAVVFALKAQSQRQRAEIAESIATSETRLVSNDQLWALIASVQASRKLQNSQVLFSLMQAQTDLQIQTPDRLQQTFSRVHEQNRLEGHGGSVYSVSFSSDGQTIASASADKTVKLWNSDGTWLKNLTGHNDKVNGVSFSPDGQTIASASDDKTVKLWKSDGTWYKTLIGHTDTVYSVSFSPDSQTIASASADKTVKLWKSDGTLLKTLTKHSDRVNWVSFSPDGQTLASASNDKTVKIWKPDGTLLKILTGHSQPVYSVSFSPDGQTIASASDDKTVKHWKRDGTLLNTFTGHNQPVYSVSFSPDGKTIASGSLDNTLRLWKCENALRRTLAGHTKQVTNVSFSPDGQTLASASLDKLVKLWSPDGKELKTLKGHTDAVWGVSFSPEGLTIASASADKTIKLWKRDGTLLNTLTGHSDKVFSVSFSPDGKTLVSGSGDHTVKLWRRDGRELKTLTEHTDKVNWVTFSPDGQTIASASDDNTVKLWRSDGTFIKPLEGHTGHVNWVSFSADGKTIASASDDQTVKLWKSDDGTLLKTLKDRTGKVWSVTFSPDSKTIASASDDNTVKLWSENGTLLYTLKGYSGSVFSVSFSKDGNTLASASDDNTVILRDLELDLDTLLKHSCDWLHDYLKHLKTKPNLVDCNV